MAVMTAWGFAKCLVEAGVLTQEEVNRTSRIVIDCQADGTVQIYVQKFADSKALAELAPSTRRDRSARARRRPRPGHWKERPAMAKQSGLGARFLVGGYDISGDVSALDSIGGTQALLDSTDITQSAHSRITGLRLSRMMNSTVFMDTANAHPVLSALPTSDEKLMTFLVPPMAAGQPRRRAGERSRSATTPLAAPTAA